jgi:2-succinyl-5-enolpyruvyl-6-hydroxy-3-cyclohexene-1-carboxylate synthase
MPPDFSYIARAYGLAYRKIGSRAELSEALQRFGQRRQAIVLEMFADEFK